MRPKARAYSHQGHGPRAEHTGRIHISDFRNPRTRSLAISSRSIHSGQNRASERRRGLASSARLLHEAAYLLVPLWIVSSKRRHDVAGPRDGAGQLPRELSGLFPFSKRSMAAERVRVSVRPGYRAGAAKGAREAARKSEERRCGRRTRPCCTNVRSRPVCLQHPSHRGGNPRFRCLLPCRHRGSAERPRHPLGAGWTLAHLIPAEPDRAVEG